MFARAWRPTTLSTANTPRPARRRCDPRRAPTPTPTSSRPRGSSAGDSLTGAGQLRRRLSTQLSGGERPSAMRELGLGALQAWDALSEAQRRRRGAVDVAILFTDLVGFSAWALKAGDESTVELLNRVVACESDAISDHGGVVVKRLGDGSMAVFDGPAEIGRAHV